MMPEQFLAELDSKVVPVYHGTRQSLGAAILRDGFHPAAINDHIAAVAETHGVPTTAIHDHLLSHNRFSVLHSERAGTVSTTADEYKAESWAGRAPEATWDALRAVFALTHPELDDDYAISDAADFWVMTQRVDDPPVIITVQAPLHTLQSHGFSAGKTASELLRWALNRTESPDPAGALAQGLMTFQELFQDTPEWRIPIDAAQVVAMSEPVALRVPPSLLAYLSGQSVVELGSPRQCSAQWGPPGNPTATDAPWWPFHQVWKLLSPQRQTQLQEFAGRAIH